MLPTETPHLCLRDFRTDVESYSQLGINIVCSLITLRCASVMKGSRCNSSSQSWKWMKDSSENEAPGCSSTLKPLNAGPHFLCPCLHFCLPPNPTFLLPGIFGEWAERGFSFPLMQPAAGEQRISDTLCSFAVLLSRLNEEYFDLFSPSVFLPGNKR